MRAMETTTSHLPEGGEVNCVTPYSIRAVEDRSAPIPRGERDWKATRRWLASHIPSVSRSHVNEPRGVETATSMAVCSETSVAMCYKEKLADQDLERIGLRVVRHVLKTRGGS